MTYAKSIFVLVTPLLFGADISAAHPQADQSKCESRRAAFDVGSAATRMRVAVIDKCLQKVKEELLLVEQAIPFREDLKQSNGQFSDAVMAKAIEVLGLFKEKATQLRATEFAGVATAAFREAKNSAALVSTIKGKLGIAIHVIDQRTEGKIGFYGALAKSPTSSNMVVWDIGGGSMQLTYKDDKGIVDVYEGSTASIQFNDDVLRALKGPKVNPSTSPNPMYQSGVTTAVQLAKKRALQVENERLLARLKSRDVEVIGIGGVHFHSVKGQIEKLRGTKINSFTRSDVLEAARARSSLTDTKLGGPPAFAKTDVTNLALVAGFMDALGIERVTPLEVNMADGVLLDPSYWR